MPVPDPIATPITIDLPNLDDLKRRLEQVRWPPIVGDDDWCYGVTRAWAERLRDHWLHQWQWQDEAERINRYQHFRVELEPGVPIHFMHVRSGRDNAKPLLLIHGWPWTFWDFQLVIEALIDGSGGQAFDLVIPSLPGYGFSTPLQKSGISVVQIADLFDRLMTEVCGYHKYCIHGDDWGALITGQIGARHPQHLYGVHLGMATLPAVPILGELNAEAFDADEQWMVEQTRRLYPHITSHVAVHSTDPQTLAYGLMESPLATAAWLGERRINWSDADIEGSLARDINHLCTTAAIYWCTGAITSSLRLYYEYFGKLSTQPSPDPKSLYIEVPTGIAIFPKDLPTMPRKVAAANCNLQRWTVMACGGHFGAAENPEQLVSELREFYSVL